MGKQSNPVKGTGSQPVQKNRKVRTPKTRLKMDWVLTGGAIFSSFIFIDIMVFVIK